VLVGGVVVHHHTQLPTWVGLGDNLAGDAADITAFILDENDSFTEILSRLGCGLRPSQSPT
jgi:hypothetical protein